MTTNDEHTNNVIINLFVREMEEQLVKKALDHITPTIRETARAIVADMQPQVVQYIEEMSRQHVYQVEVRLKEKT